MLLVIWGCDAHAQLSLYPEERQVEGIDEIETIEYSAGDESPPEPDSPAPCPPWVPAKEDEYSWNYSGLTVVGNTDGPALHVSRAGAAEGTVTVTKKRYWKDQQDTPAPYPTTLVSGGRLTNIVEGKIKTIGNGIIFDGYEVNLELDIKGIAPADVTIEFDMKAPGNVTVLNTFGHANHEFVKGADNNHWTIKKAIWYGVPGALCSYTNANIPLWVYVKFGGAVVAFDNKNIDIVLDDGSVKGSFIQHDSVYAQEGSTVVQGGVYTVAFKPTVLRNPYVQIDNTKTQYFEKIEKEENYHFKQSTGDVSREEGACDDLFTEKGLRYHMALYSNAKNKSDLNATAYEYDDASEALAIATALTDLSRVWRLEEDLSEQYLNNRRCYREKKAKDFVGFTEAYTYQCAYVDDGSCTENPSMGLLHPAYAIDP